MSQFILNFNQPEYTCGECGRVYSRINQRDQCQNSHTFFANATAVNFQAPPQQQQPEPMVIESFVPATQGSAIEQNNDDDDDEGNEADISATISNEEQEAERRMEEQRRQEDRQEEARMRETIERVQAENHNATHGEIQRLLEDAADGDHFPYKSSMHQLFEEFFTKLGGDIPQNYLYEIVKFSKELVGLARQDPLAKVPAADLIINPQKRQSNKIPFMKITEHTATMKTKEGNKMVLSEDKFSMIPISESIKLLVSNPTTADEICRLPDFTPGQLNTSTQGKKWKHNQLFQHPMITIQKNGREVDYWVGDLVKCEDTMYVLSKFFTIDHSKVMAEVCHFYKLIQFMHANDNTKKVYRVYDYPEHQRFKYSITAQPLCIPVRSIDRIFTNKPLTLNAVAQEDSNPRLSNRHKQELRSTFQRLRTLSPYKRVDPSGKRDYLRVKVVPVNMFSDDMSGNTTKKFNKFDNWSYVPAALNYKKRNALENTFYICASNKLSAPRMLRPIVDDLVDLEKGVEMKTDNNETVVVVVPVQFITADNARHSELASAPGARARRSCRTCTWDCNTPYSNGIDDYVAEARSTDRIREIYNEYLESTSPDPQQHPTWVHDESILEKQPEGYKLVGGEELLRLKSFDVLADLPTELLHTIMLGVGKSLVTTLLDCFLTEGEKAHLQRFLYDYDRAAFSRTLRTPFRWCGSYLGRDFKILIQQIPLALQVLIRQNLVASTRGLEIVINCFVELGRLASLVYMQNIEMYSPSYMLIVSNQVGKLRDAIHLYETEAEVKHTPRSKKKIYHTSKLHRLFHLCHDIENFGSALFFETEKGEQFNKFIREAIFRTNRHSSSRDVAWGFSRKYMTHHIVTGGAWMDDNNEFKKAKPTVVENAYSTKVTRNYADNNSGVVKIKQGSSGYFSSNNSSCAPEFVGKVVDVSNGGVVTMQRYDFVIRSPQANLLPIASTSIKTTDPFSFHQNINDMCVKDPHGNVLLVKSNTFYTCKLAELKLNVLMDFSIECGDFNVINPCKFGTAWWLLSHKISLL